MIILMLAVSVVVHRVINKFPEFAISIQGNKIPSISLHHLFEAVIVILPGKLHLFNALSKHPFEVNNKYLIDLDGYCPCYVIVTGKYLFYFEYILTTKSLEA